VPFFFNNAFRKKNKPERSHSSRRTGSSHSRADEKVKLSEEKPFTGLTGLDGCCPN
jgi:hypothetical protein